MLIALLSFSRYLAIKCMSSNNEPFMINPTIIDFNPVKLNYYPFMISLDKCRGNCNAADDLTTKWCVQSKTKDVNVPVFNKITRINATKTLI